MASVHVYNVETYLTSENVEAGCAFEDFQCSVLEVSGAVANQA